MALDGAANEFYREGTYRMEGQALGSGEMINYYEKLCDQYPIYSLEDGLAEDDVEGWKKMTERLGERAILVGDDLFVTNRAILPKGDRGEDGQCHPH